jgi:hypothetical protein
MKDGITLSAALTMCACEPVIWRKGLNDENPPSPPSPGKNILLTFPFIEPGESPRFREESLHLGMRAAVDQVL